MIESGTVVDVYTERLGDELAAGRTGATNIFPDTTLTVDSGALAGWTGYNVVVSGPTGAPAVGQDNPHDGAWLRSPPFPVTAGLSYAVAIGVGDEPQTVALVFSDGSEVETTSANRVQVTGIPGASGSAWLELRWSAQDVTSGYGSGAYNEGPYGG